MAKSIDLSVLRIKLLILVITALLFPLTNRAEPNLIQEIYVPDSLFIGTPISLSVSITTEEDIVVYHPEKDTIGTFAVINVLQNKELHPPHSLSHFRYLLASFETGEVRIPPLTFELYDPMLESTTLLKTDPVYLTVSSVLADTSNVIQDIAPPIRLRYGHWDYILPLLFIIFIATVTYFIWRKLLRKTESPLLEEVDIVPAYQRALQLLYKLREEKLLERGDYLGYYFRLSYILRYFLEKHYKFAAVEMTTSEIKAEINHYLSGEKEPIAGFLRDTDLVKFAKHKPTVNRSLELTEWLEKYLKSFSKSLTEFTKYEDEPNV